MLVKAKWNIKDAAGWHEAGEVFQTEEDLGNAVEVLEAPKKQAPAKAPEEAAPVEKEPAKAKETPRSSTRRRKTSE